MCGFGGLTMVRYAKLLGGKAGIGLRTRLVGPMCILHSYIHVYEYSSVCLPHFDSFLVF